MIPRVYAPAILALVTSGKIALFFKSGESSNEGCLPLTHHCLTINKTKSGQQRTPKPSCCDGTIDLVTAFKMLKTLAKNGKIPRKLAKIQLPKYTGCLFGALT